MRTCGYFFLMNNTIILEESPNGFPIVKNSPKVNYERGLGVSKFIFENFSHLNILA